MRKIPVFTFGTYYKPYCPTEGPNSWEMRRLCWWAKDEPSKPGRPQDIRHHHHPSRWLVRLDSARSAHDYAAQLIAHNIDWVRKTLLWGTDPIAFVPVPSSTVVLENWETGRWSGREIGQRLEDAGAGEVWPFVVNKVPTTKKIDGGKMSFDELKNNYQRHEDFPRARIVYLDDILTHGDHLAALDAALGHPKGASAICIAVTDTRQRDAYEPQIRTVHRTRLGHFGEYTEVLDGTSY